MGGRPGDRMLKQVGNARLRSALKKFPKDPKVRFMDSLDAPSDAIDLLEQMLTWKPSNRIDASTALFHEFLEAAASPTVKEMRKQKTLLPPKDPNFLRSMSEFEDVKLD